MGKFRQISTELWPWIDIRNWFSFSIFSISLSIFFKLCMRADIGRSVLGLKMGKFCHIFTELQALIYVQNYVFLNIFITNGWILIIFCVLAYIDKIWAWIITI